MRYILRFRSARLAWGTYLEIGASVPPGPLVCITGCDPRGTKDSGRDRPIGVCNLLGIHPTREEQDKGSDRN